MDLTHAKAMMAQFDAETRAMLLDAGEKDIAEWTERLIEASRAGDAEGQSRARHALKGLCEHFGARSLMEHCERDLSDPAAADGLRRCRETALRALREVAGE